MNKKYEKYLQEMTLSPSGVWTMGRRGSNIDSLFEVLREYISDAEKSYWNENYSDSIKSLNTVRNKVVKDLIDEINKSSR